MRKKRYKILSFQAVGTILPHSLRDVQETLAAMGHRVYVVDLPSLPTDQLKEIAVMDALIEVQPDIVFTIDAVGVIPYQYHHLNPEIKVISWFFDAPTPYLKDLSIQLINSNYYLFCWDKAYADQVLKRGVSRFFHMPFGTNPLIYKPVDCPKIYDISFVGTWSEKRQKVLKSLADRGLIIDLFGNGRWAEFQHDNIRFHGFADNRSECPLIYNQSKINLNITNEQLLTSLPVRIFDVGSCQSFLLTDEQQDAMTFFNEDELVIYRGIDDLEKKIRYFLEHESTREEVAANLKQKINNRFTFEAKIREILQIIEEDETPAVNRPASNHELSVFSWKAGLSFLHKKKYDRATQSFIRGLQVPIEDEKLKVALITALSVAYSQAGQQGAVEQIIHQTPAMETIINRITALSAPNELRAALYGLNPNSFSEEANVIKGKEERVFA